MKVREATKIAKAPHGRASSSDTRGWQLFPAPISDRYSETERVPMSKDLYFEMPREDLSNGISPISEPLPSSKYRSGETVHTV